MSSGHSSQTNPNDQKIIQDCPSDEMKFQTSKQKLKETSGPQWPSSHGYTVDHSETVSED